MSKIQRQLRDELDLAIRERDAARDLVERVKTNAQRDLEAVQRGHSEEVTALRRELFAEQQQRMAAQRGLVPYVRSLELFDIWLCSQPRLRESLRPKLQELGLWEIKLGYDPDKDLGLSVVSPLRF